MKILIGFILVLLAFYLLWKWIKRLIIVKIFKTLNQNFPQSNGHYREEEPSNDKKNKEFKKDIKWDAETVEFEEIPKSKDKN